MAGLFRTCGVVAAVSMAALFLMIFTGIILRFFGMGIPGNTQYAGYLMACTFFLGLPYAMHRNKHVAVDLLIQRLSPGARDVMALISAVMALVACIYWAYHSVNMVILSVDFGDLSEGADATPLWIPQSFMALGLGLFCLAIVEQLVRFKRRYRRGS
jgi:C4-dicarboxylate transporter, DctM subunit